MLTYDDPRALPARRHPWTVGEADEEWRYVDFKARPDLIRTSLEDFVILGDHPAIDRFYDLVAWINGPHSAFESNDCAIRPPKHDSAPPPGIPAGFTTRIQGRLTIFHRNLSLNCDRHRQRRLLDGLRDGIPECAPAAGLPAAVGLSSWPHGFIDIGREGQAASLRFSAWGRDGEHSMAHLEMAFECIGKCLETLSEALSKDLSAGVADGRPAS